MSDNALDKLREPFPPEQIGKLPRITCKDCRDSKYKNCDKHSKNRCNECGNNITSAHMHLDYVGHAAVTARLLDVDPEWYWEPLGFDDHGEPMVVRDGSEASMWITLHVAGHSRHGVGICPSNGFELRKQLISDAIRNAAMRFGVALDLWSKESLGDPGQPAEHTPPDPEQWYRDNGWESSSDHDQHREKLTAAAKELDDEAAERYRSWWKDEHLAWPVTKDEWRKAEAMVEMTRNGEEPF